MMRKRIQNSKREPTIALINIVFLMLVFFMVSGTLAPPMNRNIELVNTANLEGRPPPNALVIDPEGGLSFRGKNQADVETYMAGLTVEERQELRLVPDRTLLAATLVDLGRTLRRAGAGKVIIVSERGLE
ncbi:MAG: biopolymer transporter ExbD [Roseobacter sp.]